MIAVVFLLAPPGADVGKSPTFMYGFYYHFNNLRFNKSHDINDLLAAHVVIVCRVLNEFLKCMLLKLWLDHPVKDVVSRSEPRAPRLRAAPPFPGGPEGARGVYMWACLIFPFRYVELHGAMHI